MDVFQKCREFTRAQEARDAGVYLMYREIGSPQDPVVTMDGQKVVMLGSNNYLGLTSHPKVKEAAIAATAKYGTGCAGSRLLNGNADIHIELEERLAAFMNRESVLVFSTGYGVKVLPSYRRMSGSLSKGSPPTIQRSSDAKPKTPHKSSVVPVSMRSYVGR